MRFSVRLSEFLRGRLESYAQTTQLTVSQAARQLTILGAGGSFQEAQLENELQESKRLAAKERLQTTHPEVQFGRPSPRALESTRAKATPVISFRISSEWHRKINANGGAKRCLISKLELS